MTKEIVSINELEVIEASLNITYPNAFWNIVRGLDRRGRDILLSAFFSECRFIKTPQVLEHFRFQRLGLVPFMYSGSIPNDTDMEIDGDAYCFEMKDGYLTDAITVFAVHTIVAKWETMDEFLAWAETQKQKTR